MKTLLKLVAMHWQKGLVIGLAGLAFYYSFTYGKSVVQAKWDKAVATQAQQVSDKKIEQASATATVVTEYVDRIQIVERRGATILKEVPIYVTKEDNARCGVIGDGFVSLWNTSNAEPTISDAPGTPDAGASQAVGN